MHVTVLTIGSRGDVEPFLALGTGLRRAGHQVRIATHAAFATLVEGAGLEFAELPGDPQAALSSPDGQAMLATRNPVALPGLMRRVIGPGLAEAAVPAERACAGADVVLAASLALMGTTAAEVAGARLVQVHLQPSTPTRAFAAAAVPVPRDLPGPVNLFTWALSERLLWRAVRPVLAQRRRELRLAPLPAGPPSRWSGPLRAPTLYGYSAAVAPVPPDWPSDVHVTGYWWRDAPVAAPSPELVDFLDDGPRPVYVGFGSMPHPDPAGLTDALLTGLRRAGLRAVLHSGWSGLRPADSSPDVLVVGEVPHPWLFPRVAAVMHHGGAGTTAAGLRAGTPTVVVPFFSDQFFWGRRVAALGAGPVAVPRERLTADVVAASLTSAVGDPRFRAGAAAVAAQLAGEDGVASAIGVLERLAG